VAEQLAKIKAGAYLSSFAVKDDMKVSVYSDSAVVTGRSTHKGEYKARRTNRDADVAAVRALLAEWVDAGVEHVGVGHGGPSPS
jgi:hypothetical protein